MFLGDVYTFHKDMFKCHKEMQSRVRWPFHIQNLTCLGATKVYVSYCNYSKLVLPITGYKFFSLPQWECVLNQIKFNANSFF